MEAASAAGGETANGARIGAAIIDAVIVFVIFLVFGVAFGDSSSGGGGASVNLTGGPFVIYVVVAILYYAVPEGLTGASLGKRLVGLRVTRDGGSPVGFGRALGRNTMRVIDALPFFYLVGLITMLVRSDSKRVGDIAAGTVVRRAPKA